MASTPMERYLADVNAGLLIFDELQHKAVARLEQCFQQLLQQKVAPIQQDNTLQQFFCKILSSRKKRSQAPVRHSLGCYLWGGVGRGKTHLMDYFYESIPMHLKAKRTHFHRFMKEIHQSMHQLKGIVNPLEQIAEEFSQAYDVLCLDEFVVIDITDAMLLGGLVQALFRRQVVLVTTSNAAPRDLYKDGLQRSRFLPTIIQLEQHLDIFHLDSSTDYRLRHLQHDETYKVLEKNDCPQALFDQLFQALVHEAPSVGEVTINGRIMQYCARHNDVIWFCFSAICGSLRSVSDYIDIAREYQTVLVSDIPVLDRTTEDQARRFVHLIDEFYDCHVRVYITARASISELYRGHQLAFEFERTESRLIEMQSKEYAMRRSNS